MNRQDYKTKYTNLVKKVRIVLYNHEDLQKEILGEIREYDSTDIEAENNYWGL